MKEMFCENTVSLDLLSDNISRLSRLRRSNLQTILNVLNDINNLYHGKFKLLYIHQKLGFR